MNPKAFFTAGAVVTAIAGFCCANAPASANTYNPITWDVSGTFDDGGTFSGSFSLNVYGYLTQADITTTGGSTLPGTTYNISTIGTYSNIILTTPPADGIDLLVGYNQVLQIVFQNSLEIPGTDSIVVGVGGPSFECNSISCPPGGTDGVDTRYIASGVATTPLPSTWTMLIAGCVGLGFFVYRGSRKNTAELAAA